MKKRVEQSKKMYILFVDALILLLPTYLFAIKWESKLNRLLYVDFENKGNILLIIYYMFVVTLMLFAFHGLKIGYYKIASLIISQTLALITAQAFITIQLVLMIGKVVAIHSIISNMVQLLLLDILSDICITVIGTKIYNRVWPPYRLLYIYGDYKNNLKKKIATRADKYVIEEEVYYEEPMDVMKAKILKYDGVILNDIPSDKKNLLLKLCFDNEIRAYFVPKISDIFVKGAEEINIFDTPIFLCKNIGLTTDQKVMKRIMDLIVSGLVLILASPFMLLTAIAVKLEDKGPVIYKQTRCTMGGKQFDLYKFRSMKVEAEAINGAQLAQKNDDRITKVGKFIRATRLDELPQLLNILKGEMSVVGPRPERPEFVEKNCTEIPEFQYRMKVKAGLTGYAQVYGKYSTSFLDKLKLDLLYIEKYSILLDIQIIMMTLKVVLIKESAEGLDL